MMGASLRFYRFPVIGLLLLCLLIRPTVGLALPIERITSAGGIEAWLVSEPGSGLLAFEFAFDGGSALDLPGKEGATAMMASLLTDGAGDLDWLAFQEKLNATGGQAGFAADKDVIRGSALVVTDRAKECLDLVALAMAQPRFDAVAIDRLRQRLLATQRANEANPSRVMQRILNQALFAGHPYAHPVTGTAKSLPEITAADIRAIYGARLTRAGLKVAVVGDITPSALGPILDRLFAGLPMTAGAPPSLPVATGRSSGEILVYRRQGAQSVVGIAIPAVARDDPDYLAAVVMSQILGGSTITSRLGTALRVERALTYGINSGLITLDRAALMMVEASTPDPTAVVTEVARQWQRMMTEGVLPEELADTKDWLTGTYALRFSSSAAIAGLVLDLWRQGLGPDYPERRASLIAAITASDVARVARRLLDPASMVTVIVGDPGTLAPTRVVTSLDD